MKKIIVGLLILIAIFLVVSFILESRIEGDSVVISEEKVEDQKTPEPAVIPKSSVGITKDSTTIKDSQTSKEAIFTMTIVSMHNSAQSCYSVIDKNVYDLTSWINKHPGGSAKILSICGKDATAVFANQHGGEQKPEQILAGFKIGVLE